VRRATWDETWISVARSIARRSQCVRAQIGCVIVTRTNRVIAVGYNGPPSGFTPSMESCTTFCDRGKSGPKPSTVTSYEDCPSVHAELNTISTCDRLACEGGTLYVTGGICFNCAKVIANCGVKRVIVVEDDTADHRKPDRSYAFMRRCGLEVIVRG
jgi:dCMP deaminase